MPVDPRLSELLAQVDALSSVCDRHELEEKATATLKQLPDPTTVEGKENKILLYSMRGRVKLHIPKEVKSAETDLAKAVRLDPSDVASWIAIADASWQRKALQEAKDALEAALRAQPDNQAALQRMSRVVRNEAFAANHPENFDPQGLLEESVVLAKKAVGANPADGESWMALGLALLTKALDGNLEHMRKALQALNQAAKRMPDHPDVLYNRGEVRSYLGMFVDSMADFQAAFRRDPSGLPTAKLRADHIAAMLTKVAKLVATNAGMNDKEYKRIVLNAIPEKQMLGSKGAEGVPRAVLTPLELNDAEKMRSGVVVLKVLECVSHPDSAPHIFIAADKTGQMCMLLLHKLNPDAFKTQPLVTIPAGYTETCSFRLPSKNSQDPGGGNDTELSLPAVIPEPTLLLLNGHPLKPQHFSQPRLYSKLE